METRNAVVLKPSDTTPQNTLLLAEIATPFFSKGVINAVLSNSKKSNTLNKKEIYCTFAGASFVHMRDGKIAYQGNYLQCTQFPQAIGLD